MSNGNITLDKLVAVSAKSMGADWAYYHPSAQGADARKVVVSFYPRYQGFNVQVNYMDDDNTVVIHEVEQSSRHRKPSEVLAEALRHANLMALKWMDVYSAEPYWMGEPDGMSVLVAAGFAPHTTVNGAECWRAEHGTSQCIISSHANNLHVWRNMNVFMTHTPDDTQASWDDAETEEMSLDEALREWQLAIKAEVSPPLP